VSVESWAIALAAAVSLALTSLVATRLGRLSAPRTLVRTLAVGLGTMTVSYLVGRLLF
jgi:VIT1/CCC1 family predicted Fe2+/Mn2+ transporter